MTEVWLQPNFGESLFGEFEATWHPPELFPENYIASPLVPGAVWVMSPKVFSWLAPRCKELRIKAMPDVYSRDDDIHVMLSGGYKGFIRLERRAMVVRGLDEATKQKILAGEPGPGIVRVCQDNRWDELYAPAGRRLWQRIKSYFRPIART